MVTSPRLILRSGYGDALGEMSEDNLLLTATKKIDIMLSYDSYDDTTVVSRYCNTAGIRKTINNIQTIELSSINF